MDWASPVLGTLGDGRWARRAGRRALGEHRTADSGESLSRYRAKARWVLQGMPSWDFGSVESDIPIPMRRHSSPPRTEGQGLSVIIMVPAGWRDGPGRSCPHRWPPSAKPLPRIQARTAGYEPVAGFRNPCAKRNSPIMILPLSPAFATMPLSRGPPHSSGAGGRALGQEDGDGPVGPELGPHRVSRTRIAAPTLFSESLVASPTMSSVSTEPRRRVQAPCPSCLAIRVHRPKSLHRWS